MPLQIPHPFSCSPHPSKRPAMPITHPATNSCPQRLLTSSPQIASASSAQDTITSQLSKCPSDTYIVVTQPGVHAEDYSDRYAAPHLRRKVSGEDDRIRSTMSVTDVLGQVNTEEIAGIVGDRCGAASLRIDASSMSSKAATQRAQTT